MRNQTFTDTGWAKLNLALHITGRRDDGYHNLETLVVFTELGDHLTACLADTDELTLSGPFAAQLDPDGSNLVLEAISHFRQHLPDVLPKGIHIHLKKNLPVASGIGGGSADAAATLRLLCHFADRKIPAHDLEQIALKLGADVPMCLASTTSIARGIGEEITLLEPLMPIFAVLVNPLIALSTAAIFANLARTDNAPLPSFDPELTDWLAQTRNDLQSAAQSLVPEIGKAIDLLANTKGNLLARMSGSGASTFGLYASANQANFAATALKASKPDWWIKSSKIR